MWQNLLQISFLDQFFDFIFVHVYSVVEVSTPEHIVMRVQTAALQINFSQTL
jgi:hypothetical protein